MVKTILHRSEISHGQHHTKGYKQLLQNLKNRLK